MSALNDQTQAELQKTSEKKSDEVVIFLMRQAERLGRLAKPIRTKPADVFPDPETKPEDLFTAELPFLDGNINSQKNISLFARTICKDDEGNQISFKTPAAGRSDYFFSFIFKVRDRFGTLATNMSTIMTKGSGSLEALDKTESPFSNRGGNEIEGGASLGDIRLDAKNSKTLADVGIRTRVFLGVFQLSKVDYQGKTYTPKELIDSGIVKGEENLPGIGIAACRTPFRISDIVESFERYGLNSQETKRMMLTLLQNAAYDESPDFKHLAEKYQGQLKAGEIPDSLVETLVIDYANISARVLGKQAALFERNGIISSFAENRIDNVTAMAEIVDNSEARFLTNPNEMIEFQNKLSNVNLTVISNLPGLDSSRFLDLQRENNLWHVHGYLDEMEPEWRTSQPNNFVTAAVANFGISNEQAVAAYTLAKIKFESYHNSKIEITESEIRKIRDFVYNALGGVGDEDYQKALEFVQAFDKYVYQKQG